VANTKVRSWSRSALRCFAPFESITATGTKAERDMLYAQGVAEGTFVKLNQQKWPGCYYHRSNSNDVARTEHLTFICTPSQDLAGPTNNWMRDKDAYAKLRTLYDGCMKGRTLYVVPFVMGPIGSPLAKVGVQLTDSLYVAVSMGIVTAMGEVAWKELGDSDEFTRCLHSIGDVNPDRRYVCHFPLDNTIWKLRLRLRWQRAAGQEMSRAPHCQLSRPAAGVDGGAHAADGRAGSVGRQNFRSRRHFHRVREDEFRDARTAKEVPRRRLGKSPRSATTSCGCGSSNRQASYARSIPRPAYFGVVPGTTARAIRTRWRGHGKDAIFTTSPSCHRRTERSMSGGRQRLAGARQRDRLAGQAMDARQRHEAAHPNQSLHPRRWRTIRCSILAPTIRRACHQRTDLSAAGDRKRSAVVSGFQLDARRVRRCNDRLRNHRRRYGAVGVVRRDQWRCFVHWLQHSRLPRSLVSDAKENVRLPAHLSCQLVRKNDKGQFMWPGFGENMRVRKWIIDRCKGRRTPEKPHRLDAPRRGY